MNYEEEAEMLEVEVARVQQVLFENDLVDKDGKPLPSAIDGGFFSPEGQLKKRGMTLLISQI